MNKKNKIVIDNIVTKNGDILFIDKNIKKIQAKEESIINIYNEQIDNLNIEVLDNANTIINIFTYKEKVESNILININKKASITLNYSFINNNNHNLNINTNFLSEESSINVNITGITDKGNSNIIVDGYVNENSSNNVLNENIKLININEGKSNCKPSMYIDTNKVVANHANSIGMVSDSEIMYLMSKGISKEKSIELICNGFIVSNIKESEMLRRIKEFIYRR